MRKTVLLLCVCLSCLTGCATAPTDPELLRIYEQNNDPLEPMNRAIFGVNMFFDRTVFKPIAKGYRAVMPDPFRRGLTNFFANLRQPVYLANALFQGEGKQAAHISQRFLANTFWGMWGFFDVASDMRIPVEDNDFGETLAVWGVRNSGPYLVLPFFGPSNFRDAVGFGADAMMVPVDWLLINEPIWLYTHIGMANLDRRERSLEFVENLQKSSTDFYATSRTMYQQNRQKQINQVLGISETASSPDYEFEFTFDDE